LKSRPESSHGPGVTNGHGGARTGSGRPPKAVRYAHEVATQEARLVAALPKLADLLLAAARAGDTAAARYLVDRVLGRVQTQARPVAEDYTLPWDHAAAESTAEIRRRRELAKELAPNPRGREASREVLAAEHIVVGAELDSLADDAGVDVASKHMLRRRMQETWPAREPACRDELELLKARVLGDGVPVDTAA